MAHLLVERTRISARRYQGGMAMRTGPAPHHKFGLRAFERGIPIVRNNFTASAQWATTGRWWEAWNGSNPRALG